MDDEGVDKDEHVCVEDESVQVGDGVMYALRGRRKVVVIGGWRKLQTAPMV
jgi:hypothetical protein